MIGALILGFLAGVIGRLLMPGDVFRHMNGPTSWLVSLALGLVGAAVGWFLFTYLLGIGDDDVFDLGGILSAIIGVLIVLPIAGFILRRTGLSPERPKTTPAAALASARSISARHLDARRDAELVEQVAQVGLDRLRAQVQLGRDLRVRPAVDDQPRDLQLALGE